MNRRGLDGGDGVARPRLTFLRWRPKYDNLAAELVSSHDGCCRQAPCDGRSGDEIMPTGIAYTF